MKANGNYETFFVTGGITYNYYLVSAKTLWSDLKLFNQMAYRPTLLYGFTYEISYIGLY